MMKHIVAQSESAVALPPVLEFSTVSQFVPIWNDKGSGADRDGAFYRPVAPEGWYLLGDYGQGNYQPPTGPVLVIRVVENDDPDHPALAAPSSWVQIWNDRGSGADQDGSFWAPIPPFGYVVCGHAVAEGHDSPPNIPNFRCLRYDLAKSVALGGLIWNDRGSGADADVSIYRVPELNVIWAIPSYDPPTELANIPAVLVSP